VLVDVVLLHEHKLGLKEFSTGNNLKSNLNMILTLISRCLNVIELSLKEND
jgi:hypothetical protein